MTTYRTILIDPPWPQVMTGKYKNPRNQRPHELPYQTMGLEEMRRLPVGQMAHPDCHLWLWTTNQSLEAGFYLMREWGFRYLGIVHAIKPSGTGNYFIHRTQSLLMGYRDKCRFPQKRYVPNIITVGQPVRHSQKWDETYRYIEEISPGPRLEMFARQPRDGWDVWGNEVESSIRLPVQV